MISEIATISQQSPNSVNKIQLQQIETVLTDDSESDCEEYITDKNIVAIANSENDNKLTEIEVPSFGNVSVLNSNDVHFGNNTFYQGPVIIKQFLLPGNEIQERPSLLNICDNKVNNVINNEIIIDNRKLNNKICTSEENPLTIRGFEGFKKHFRKHLLLLVILFVVLSILLLVLTIVLLLKHGSGAQKVIGGYVPRPDSNEQDWNIHQDERLVENLTLPEKLRLQSRVDWIARPTERPLNPLPIPVPYVIILGTKTESCHDQAKCRLQVVNLQNYHIESNNLADIKYNFLVGGDGEGYFGRGWKFQGDHTFNYNSRSIGIAFIGLFTRNKPPEQQIVACKKLIAMGVDLEFIQKNYKLFGARQLDSGEKTPGDALFEEIKTWDHWSNHT